MKLWWWKPHAPVLVPVQDVWRGGCEALGRNACELLRVAGKPVTAGNVRALICGMPCDRSDLRSNEWMAQSPVYACLRAAYDKRRAGAYDPARYAALKEYFVTYWLDLPRPVRRMLADSFIGVLGSVTFDERVAEEIIPGGTT